MDPLTGIRRLSSYYKRFKLIEDLIKNRMSITNGMTTKLLEITGKKTMMVREQKNEMKKKMKWKWKINECR